MIFTHLDKLGLYIILFRHKIGIIIFEIHSQRFFLNETYIPNSNFCQDCVLANKLMKFIIISQNISKVSNMQITMKAGATFRANLKK